MLISTVLKCFCFCVDKGICIYPLNAFFKDMGKNCVFKNIFIYVGLSKFWIWNELMMHTNYSQGLTDLIYFYVYYLEIVFVFLHEHNSHYNSVVVLIICYICLYCFMNFIHAIWMTIKTILNCFHSKWPLALLRGLLGTTILPLPRWGNGMWQSRWPRGVCCYTWHHPRQRLGHAV